MLNKTIDYLPIVILITIVTLIIYYTSNLYILIPTILLILVDQRIRFKGQYFEIEYLKLNLDSPYIKPKLPIIIDIPLLFIFYITWHVTNKVRGLF